MRYFKPGPLLLTSEDLWVLDIVQPVAVRLGLTSGALRPTAWSEVTTPADNEFETRFASDDAGIWCQYEAEGPLVRIAAGGLEFLSSIEHFTLGAADRRGAWCLSGADQRRSSNSVIVVSPQGRVQYIETDQPVASISANRDSVYIGIACSQTDRKVSEYLRLPSDQAVPNRLGLSRNQVVKHAPSRRWSNAGKPGPARKHAPGLALKSGLSVAGLRWEAGWAGSGPRFLRRSVVTGHHAVDGSVQVRCDLGVGTVLAMAGAGERIWISMDRSSVSAPVADTELLELNASTGQLTKLLTDDCPDISADCWERVDTRGDRHRHVRKWLEEFSDLDGVANITESRVQVSGEWPDVEMLLSFAHPSFPAGRIRRRYQLFDELGRMREPGYVGVYLMEDLESGNLPPGELAKAGVLEI